MNMNGVLPKTAKFYIQNHKTDGRIYICGETNDFIH